MSRRDLQVSVESFGPIRSGSVSVKPLTLFIGPNNSGKSFMALLIYALTQAMTDRLSRSLRWNYRRPLGDSSDLEALPRVAFATIPPSQQERVRGEIAELLSTIRPSLETSLRDYFGVDDPKDLVQSGGARKSFSIRVNASKGEVPFLALRMGTGRPVFELHQQTLDDLVVPATDQTATQNPSGWLNPAALAGHLFEQILRENGFSPQGASYLPAARSGILTAARFLQWAAIETVRRRFGSEPIEFAAFSGVTADFLQTLALLDGPGLAGRSRPRDRVGRRKGMEPAIEALEGGLLQGRVTVRRDGTERSSIRYESAGLSLPLHRTSSMVAELAPLDLWLRRVVEPGDLLIIEEPEAHLHPENQRRLATVLVRLVRAGVNVLCPTHSSLILHQLSNHILASQADPAAASKLGLAEQDRLTPDEVGVYLFSPGSAGTRISPVEVDAEFGISEDEFLRVYEAIGNETYFLEAAQPAVNGVAS